MINIIAGNYKKTKLNVPIGSNVRPTSALKRKAIFSIIESYAQKNSYDIYSEFCFIDFFAGSGSLGLEAISRGALFSYFFENDNTVIKILESNCKKICKKNNFKIIKQDITNLNIKKFEFPISVIFIDPPYIQNPFKKLLQELLKKNIINDKTIIVIETDKNNSIEIPASLKIINKRFYRRTNVIFVKKI